MRGQRPKRLWRDGEALTALLVGLVALLVLALLGFVLWLDVAGWVHLFAIADR